MTAWQIIRWWELRRLLYNAILFVIGIASIMTIEMLMQKVIPVGEVPSSHSRWLSASLPGAPGLDFETWAAIH